MSLDRFPQEPFGGRQIAPLAEPELDCVAIAVDRPVQMPPLASDLDIRLIDMPPAGDRALAPIELLQQKWGIIVRIRAGPPCGIEAFGRALAISTSLWTVL
jgi:hypothetical protein